MESASPLEGRYLNSLLHSAPAEQLSQPSQPSHGGSYTIDCVRYLDHEPPENLDFHAISPGERGIGHFGSIFE